MKTAERIASVLKELDIEESDQYIAEEWIEAVDEIGKLDKPVTLEIPFCIYDLKLDATGEVVLQKRFDEYGNRRDLDEDGEIKESWRPGPVRVFRFDVFCILAWIAMKREDPDLTLGHLRGVMNDELLEAIHDDVMFFWGIDIKSLREIQEQVDDTARLGGEAEILDFPLSDKPEGLPEPSSSIPSDMENIPGK
jgi:hypothetical protein